MRRIFAVLFCVLGVLMTDIAHAGNPFLEDWNTPFEVPPFGTIELEHYQPAFQEAMQRHEQEVRDLRQTLDSNFR